MMSQTFCKENTICFFKALFKFGSTMEENELRVKVNSEGWIIQFTGSSTITYLIIINNIIYFFVFR